MPALLTRTSTRPKASTTASTISRTCLRSVRSAANPAARVPVSCSSAARSWIRSVVEQIATAAPSRPRIFAVANPIPVGEPAPVTRATLSASSASIRAEAYRPPHRATSTPPAISRKLNARRRGGAGAPFRARRPPTTGVVASSDERCDAHAVDLAEGARDVRASDRLRQQRDVGWCVLPVVRHHLRPAGDPLLRIFTKAGRPAWAAFVPIYSTIVLLEVVGRPVWWIILF